MWRAHKTEGGADIRDGVGTTSDGLLAALAVPDTDGVAADSDLSAECASVLGVLGDLHLLHLLTQGSTISVLEQQTLVSQAIRPSWLLSIVAALAVFRERFDSFRAMREAFVQVMGGLCRLNSRMSSIEKVIHGRVFGLRVLWTSSVGSWLLHT